MPDTTNWLSPWAVMASESPTHPRSTALKRAVNSGLPAVLDVMVNADVHIVPPDLALIDSVWMEGCDAAGSVCVWE
jgi:hypothetical protein